MMRAWPTPKAVAACTNSSSRSFSVSPRTSRHSVAQPVRPRITQSRKIFRSERSSAGLEQVGVLVEEDLHHQHAGGDQQHVGHRAERRVEVLDHLVDPAAEVARQDAQHDRERQRRHRGQRADHEGRAHALERLVRARRCRCGRCRTRGSGPSAPTIGAAEQADHDQGQQRGAQRQVGAVARRCRAAPRPCRRGQRRSSAARHSAASAATTSPPSGAERGARARRRPPTRAAGSARCAPPNFRRGKSRTGLPSRSIGSLFRPR